MTDWNVTFTNATLMPWVAAIWQELPDAGLSPVSWQQAQAAPAMTVRFAWNDSYAVSLASYQDAPPSGTYSLLTFRTAQPGSVWEIITINQVDYLADAGIGPDPGVIVSTNRSTGPVNAGLMQTGAPVAYAHSLAVDSVATFTLQPQFRFGLFVDLQPGQVIEPALIIVGPQPLTFPPGVESLIVTAVLQGQTIVITVVPA